MSSSRTGRSYDAVVVGAGIVGLSCAWRAAGRGLSVLCVDSATPGSGASRAAAGMLAPTTEADFGEEALLRLNLEAAAAWPAFRDELEEAGGIDVGHRASGALEVAADRDDLEELGRRLAFRRSLGLEAEWLSGRDCRRLEPGLSPRVSGGIEAPGDGHVNPRAVIAALASALERSGVSWSRLPAPRSSSATTACRASTSKATGAWPRRRWSRRPGPRRRRWPVSTSRRSPRSGR